MFYFLLTIYFLFFLVLAIKNIKLAIYLIIFTLPAYLIRFQIFGLPFTLLECEILILFFVFLLLSFRTPKGGEESGISILSFRALARNLVFKNLIFNTRSLTGVRDDKKKEFCLPDFGEDDKKSKPLFLSISLFIFCATISIFVSPNFREALGIWKAYFIEPLLFCIVFIKTIRKEDLKNIFFVFAIQTFLLSVFAIYQKFTGFFIANPFWATEATRRVTSIFPYPNALALYLAPIVIMLFGFVLTIYKKELSKKIQITDYGLWITIFYILACIFGLFAIYFTKSKGALFAILAGLIFYTIFYKNYRKIFAVIIICIFAFSCFYILINGMPNFKGTSTVAGGDSFSTRIEMWDETFQMLKTKPIFGAGLTGYQQAVAPFHKKSYIEIYLYPHNIFLNFWSEIGLFGLLAFLGIIFWFYKTGFKQQLSVVSCQLSVILLAGMTCLLIHGLVDVPYFKNDLAILFWIIIGVMVISTQIHTNKNTN